jgi:hypothetical protein
LLVRSFTFFCFFPSEHLFIYRYTVSLSHSLCVCVYTERKWRGE